MSLKVGDIIENAIWMTGDEPEGMKERYKDDVLVTIASLCAQEGYEHGPITMHELKPGDHRCPEVPEHIQGSKVRLLVVESTLVTKLVIDGEHSFVGNLDRNDLVKLRKITRDRAAKDLKKIISDDECDEIIELLGTDAALATLRTIH